MHESLSAVARPFQADGAGTRARFGSPVLLWSAASPSTEQTWQATQAFMLTASGSPDRWVLPLVKAQGAHNPFALGITLGRVPNNDLVLTDDTVSRFHAFFQLDERTGTWAVTDAESRHGTFVDGRKVEPNGRLTLEDGARLRFGGAELQFLLPDTFIRLLGSL